MSLYRKALFVSVSITLFGCIGGPTVEQPETTSEERGFVIDPNLEIDESGMVIDSCSPYFAGVYFPCGEGQAEYEFGEGEQSAKVFRLGEEKK